MFHILTRNEISPAGLSLLDPLRFQYSDSMENPEGILVRSADLHKEAFPPSLMAIARAGAGVNNIPVADCSEKGIVVFNTPGANANAVKELVMAGMLLSARKIIPAVEWAKTLKGYGPQVPNLIEKGKSQFAGPELEGKTLGVIGLGAIGRKVANMAVKFGMKVLGFDPFLSVDSAWELSHSVVHANSIEEVCRESDLITLHVPYGPNTKDLINASTLQMMKPGVRLLNFARGELVNTASLLDALEQKRVLCYVTDFPTDEMLDRKGVIPIPHLGASTPESEENCARMAAQQLADFLENGNITNSVNLPALQMERATEVRVGIVNRNIPNMIAQISGVFSEAGINIVNMANKSRDTYAYTVLDVEKNLEEGFLQKLEAIDGVIRAFLFQK